MVYCKPPFGSADKVLSYLGRNTNRVAISNQRILSLENGKVTFLWRNYARGNEVKPMTLDAQEFIRRFLLHILPDGFRKIRHYTLFAARDKGKRLSFCRRLTGTPKPKPEMNTMEQLLAIFGSNFNLCPCCGLGYFSKNAPLASA